MKVSHAQTDKYDAIRVNTRMSDYGYWVVEFSVTPGVYMSVMVCKTGITREEAESLAGVTVTSTTRQKVTK